MLNSDVPQNEPTEPDMTEPSSGPSDTEEVGSLTDDISALVQDGKNYAEAEIRFQKTRLSYAADRGKTGLIYLLGGVAFLHLALIGLVVGGILSLATLVGPLAATLIIVVVLLLAMIILLMMAKTKFSRVANAFKDPNDAA
ncbi:MAG: phage holin family protein [Pontixanthobacter sp.]